MRFVGIAIGLFMLASCGSADDSDTVDDGTEAAGTEAAGTDAADERCVEACARLEGCFDDFCDEQPLSPAECVAECDEDPEAFNVDAVLVASCAQINASICVEDGVDEICDCPTTGDDGVGCTDTVTCVATCPSGDNECILACLDEASASARSAVEALSTCVSDFCADAGDAAAVQACTTTNCGAEIAECFST